MVFEQKPATTR